MHPRLRSTGLRGALLALLALSGCGSSSSTSQSSSTPVASATQSVATTSTPATTTTSSSSTASEKVPTFNIQLSSPVTVDPLSARYTCDGANISPPIAWSPVPPNTAEIDLFLFNLLPVHDKLVADWAVAGLSPKLRGLPAGQLPAGAIVGRNSLGRTGYSVCPPKGHSVRYAFLMYALPQKIPVSSGFKAEALRAQALREAESAGLLGASYKRR